MLPLRLRGVEAHWQCSEQERQYAQGYRNRGLKSRRSGLASWRGCRPKVVARTEMSVPRCVLCVVVERELVGVGTEQDRVHLFHALVV